MSVNGRGATAPRLNNADANSLREFWDVYESQFAEIGAQLAEDAAAHPELANFIGAGDAESVAENRERIGEAINEGDWDAYLADMVDTGARYAEAGLSFSAWFATGRALRSKLVPLLIDEPERLADALRGVSIFIDLVILAVADSFIDSKQRIILEQQDVLRGLSTPVLELRDGLLLVPLIGFIDSERALLLTGKLLEAIAARRAVAGTEINVLEAADGPDAHQRSRSGRPGDHALEHRRPARPAGGAPSRRWPLPGQAPRARHAARRRPGRRRALARRLTSRRRGPLSASPDFASRFAWRGPPARALSPAAALPSDVPRAKCCGCTKAFQAFRAGSIPVARSCAGYHRRVTGSGAVW